MVSVDCSIVDVIVIVTVMCCHVPSEQLRLEAYTGARTMSSHYPKLVPYGSAQLCITFRVIFSDYYSRAGRSSGSPAPVVPFD